MDKLNKYLRRLKDRIADKKLTNVGAGPVSACMEHTKEKNKIFKTDGVTMFNSQKKNCKVNMKMVLSIMLMALCLFVMPNVVNAEEEIIATIEKVVTVVDDTVVITSHPQNVTAEEGKSATFAIETSGDNYTYTWLYKAPIEEFTWAEVPSSMGTSNGNTLTINNVTEEYEGYAFACLVQGDSSELSNAAYLYVENDDLNADVQLEVDDSKSLTTHWKIPAGGDEITLPLSGTNMEVIVDWGDGNVDVVKESYKKHQYTNEVETTYIIKVQYVAGTNLDWGYNSYSAVTEGSNFYTYTKYLTKLTNWGDMPAKEYGFAYCENLVEVSGDVGENTFTNVENMSHMFYGCNSLTSLDISGWNTSSVTDMSFMFYFCGNLASLDLSSFDTSNVNNMNGMFSECYHLNSITFGENFNTSNVIDMSDMFYFCSNLGSLDLSSFDTSNVNNMNSMFSDCGNLNSITFGENFNTSNVTNMGEMFSSCRSLEKLNLSSFDTRKVTNADYMFGYDEELKSLHLGENFTTLNGADMFLGCTKLKAIISRNKGASSDAGQTAPLTTLKVGDYVSYTADSTNEYVIDSSLTGYSAENGTVLRPDNTVSWRVWEVKEDGSVVITPTNPVNPVTLYGEAGFINGLNVLDDISNLYINSNLGISDDDVSSMKITDLENTRVSSDILTLRDEYVDEEGFAYGETTELTEGTIYLESDGLTMLEAPYTASSSNPATMTQTSYFLSPTWNNLKNEKFSTDTYGDLINGNTWLASPNIRLSELMGNLYNLRMVNTNKIFSCGLLYSTNSKFFEPISACTYGIRPLVTLPASLVADITDVTKDGSSAENAWVITKTATSEDTDIPVMELSTDTGIEDITTLYVPNEDAESYYQGTTPFDTVLGDERIEPILSLIGEKDIEVNRNSTYVDEGATVAGYTSDEIDAENYKQYGYTLASTGEVNTKNAGEYEITYSVTYSGETTPDMEVTRNVTVLPTDINTLTISIPEETRIYNGNAYTPVVTVSENGKPLILNEDYTVKYEGNINAGEATITITAAEGSNYTGTATVKFTINKAAGKVTLEPATSSTVYGTTSVTFKATALGGGTLSIGSKSHGTTSINNGTVTLSNIQNVAAGTKVTVVVNAASSTNYEAASATYELTITRKEIAVPSAITGLVYNGSIQTGVAEGTGYSITGNTATNAGSYEATLTLDSNHAWVGGNTDVKKISWSIDKYNLSNATVTTSAQTYTGDALTPAPTVTVPIPSGSKTTVEASNYTVTYNNNINAGTGNVIVTAKADSTNYTGTVSGTFTITRKEIAVPSAITGLVYNGSIQTGVAEGTGYSITGNTATNAGSYEATLTLDSNHAWVGGNTDVKEISWSIDKASITATVNMSGYTYGEVVSTPSVNGNAGNAAVTFYYNQTGATTSGNLWENIGSTTLSVGTYFMYAVIPETTNYYGAKTEAVMFRVSAASGITFDVELSQNEYTYDGIEKTPVVTVSLNGTALTERTDYEVEIINNKNAGKASVIVTGKGNYAGSETVVYFTIKKAAGKVTLTPETSSTAYGTTSVSFNATALGGGTLSIGSKSHGTATINNGTVTLSGIGSVAAGTKVTVVVNAASSTNYEAATATYELIIAKANATLTPTKISTSLTVSNSEVISYEYNGDGKVTAKSSNENVATVTVNEDAKTVTITGIASGTAAITISAAEGTNFNKAADAKINVTIASGNYTVNGKDYETLIAAYNALKAAGTSGEIRVNKDVEDVSELHVETGYTVLLNTNGNKITLKEKRIKNEGILTIDGGGILTARNSQMEYYISNYGTLNINNISVISEGKDNLGLAMLLLNNTDNSIININGGTLRVEQNTSVNSECIRNAKGTVNIKDGIVEQIITESLERVSNVIHSYSNLNIMGGNIKLTKKASLPNQIYARTISVSGGMFNMYGGEILSEVCDTIDGIAILVSNATLNMYDGIIESTCYYGIQTEFSNVINIVGGNISTGVYAIRGKGTENIINIGKSGDTVSTTSPELIGGTNAIKSDNGFNFYDGILKGGTAAIAGTMPTPELGYEVYTTADGKTAYLKKTVMSGDVTLSQNTYTYDENAKLPTVTVKYGNETLAEGTDYIVKYENHTNAGTAKVIVTGSGDYTGTKEVTFTINKAVGKVTLDPEASSVAYGTTSTTFTATALGGGTLSIGSKSHGTATINNGTVTLSGIGNVAAGTKVTVVVNAAASDNYEAATATYELTITRKEIAAPNAATNLVYNGSVQTGVASGTGYKVEGNTGTNAGSYKATLTLDSNYAWIGGNTDVKEISWSIAKYNLENATVTTPSVTYTGNALTPAPTVTVPIPSGKTTTVDASNYTVSYDNNENVGTGNVTVTAKADSTNYTGTASGTFTISYATYTVTFDPDGGVVNPTSKEVNYALTYEELPTPTKIGYTFAGWYNANGDKVESTSKVEIAADHQLKAKWTVNQYTITFDTDGGSEIAPITQDYGTTITAPANPTKTGYTFGGWNKEIPATMPAENITIKARWTVNKYTITFDTDGGSVIEAITQDFGTVVKAPTDPTREGYTFAGWDKEVPTTMPAENVTIKAQWTANTYKVTFESDGEEVSAKDVVYGETYGTLPTPEKAGYTFAGWFNNAGSQVSSTTVVTTAEDHTLTARWSVGGASYQVEWYIENVAGTDYELVDNKTYTGTTGSAIPLADYKKTFEGTTFEKYALSLGGSAIESATIAADSSTVIYIHYTRNEYTITFDTDGGSEIASITQDFGTVVTAPADPTKTGYTFAGWDKEIPATMPAENITITAEWTINQYTITFDTDGGNTIAAITQDYGTAIEAPANPTKTGYTFGGWDKVIPATMPAENVTIKAQWTVNQYTITFDTDGGNTIAAITQDYGTAIEAPADPTKTGYTFGGWDKVIPATMPAENITIKAKWTINKYTITFDTDGGTAISPITKDFGTAITAPANPTKTGYTFAGWDKEIPATMPAENVTIKAQWTINQYTITFDTDGGTAISPITQDFGTAITAPADPTKTGYTFGGWDKVIPATMPAENITIKAKWTVNKYTITFDTDGGSAIAPITQDYGTAVTKPADPTKTGYTFAGWDKEIPATMPAENVTIKAKWTINQYTITFDTDGGSEVKAITQDFGTAVTAPANPTKVGYTFAGWDKEIPETMPAENVTIKAKWNLAHVDAPTNVIATFGDAADLVTIRWDVVAGLKYELSVRSGDNDFVIITNNATSPYEHRDVAPSTTYEYRLRAYNEEAGVYSDYVYTRGSTSIEAPSGDAYLDTVKPNIISGDIIYDDMYLISGDKIEINFTAKDNNYHEDYTELDKEDILIKVGNEIINVADITLEKVSIESGEKFKFVINKMPHVTSSGDLSIVIPKDMIKDKALNGNDETIITTKAFVINTNITNNAPTLEVDSLTNEITITLNQTTDFMPNDVTITYEYRVSGDTEFTKSDDNILEDSLPGTDYEVRTVLKDKTGNKVVSEIATVKTYVFNPEVEISIENPVSGTYAAGTNIEIVANFSVDFTVVNTPVLQIKFGDGIVRSLNGTVDTANRKITYNYVIDVNDLGKLTSVSFKGSIKYGRNQEEVYDMTPVISGSEIYAKTTVLLKEEGKDDKYYPTIKDALNAANTLGNLSTIKLVKDEEVEETIIIDSSKNVLLDLNGKDIIAGNIIAIINNGTLEIIEATGTSEISSNGTTIVNNNKLNVTSGIIRSELIAIENSGTLTIGEDDGNVSKEIPLINSNEIGIRNVDEGKTYFNDGVIYGERYKSYEGTLNVPEGYNIITEWLENNKEKTYIGIDKNPPIISGEVITKGWQKEYVEIEITARDDESGLRYVSVDNKEITLTDGKAIIKVYENKEYVLYAEDNASNSPKEPVSVIVNTIDKMPPQFINVTASVNSGENTMDVLVDVQDIDSGLAGIMIKEDKNVPTLDEASWDEDELSEYPTSKQQKKYTLDSTKSYFVFAKDRAGNITRFDREIKVGVIDEKAPVIENVSIIKDSGKDYVSGKAVLVHVEARDNEKVSEVLITNSNITTDEARVSSDWKAYNEYMIHELPASGDSTYTVYVWVKDEAGNMSLRASASAKLKAFVVGDNEFDYTGDDEIYNKTSLRFISKDNHYDYSELLESGNLILRLTSGDSVLRNITNGLSLIRLNEYNGTTVGDFNYRGEVYELNMENLSGTGKLNIVFLDAALKDLARNETDSMVLLTDIFVDNNAPLIKVENTGTYNINGLEIRNIEIVDKEGYLIDAIEVSYNGTVTTHMLQNGKLKLGIPNGAVITAYDKAGNEAMHEVSSTVAPVLKVSEEDATLNYGGSSEIITYEYNGDGAIQISSSDTNIANVALNVNTKQITISPANAGNAEITLRTIKTENYIESKLTIRVTVLPKPVTLSWTKDEFDFDGTGKVITATVTNAILNDTVEVAEYNVNARTNAGNYKAEAIKLSNSNYTVTNGTNITKDWKINKAERPLDLDKTSLEMEMPLSKNITFTYEGANAEVEVTSSNKNVITVTSENYDGNGTIEVTPNTIGNAVVTVKIKESTNYKEAVETCNVEVIKKVRVYFDTQGGNEITSKLVTYNRAYGELETPVKDGYEFTGWYTTATNGTEVTSSTKVTNTDTHTLYARWKEITPIEIKCWCSVCENMIPEGQYNCRSCESYGCPVCGKCDIHESTCPTCREYVCECTCPEPSDCDICGGTGEVSASNWVSGTWDVPCAGGYCGSEDVIHSIPYSECLGCGAISYAPFYFCEGTYDDEGANDPCTCGMMPCPACT